MFPIEDEVVVISYRKENEQKLLLYLEHKLKGGTFHTGTMPKASKRPCIIINYINFTKQDLGEILALPQQKIMLRESKFDYIHFYQIYGFIGEKIKKIYSFHYMTGKNSFLYDKEYKEQIGRGFYLEERNTLDYYTGNRFEFWIDERVDKVYEEEELDFTEV